MQAALLWLKLWQKQRRASGLPRLQIAVRLGRLGERIGLIDVDFDLSAGNHLEECRGTGKQILPLGRVGHEGRAGDIKRTLGRKRCHAERRDRARGIAEADRSEEHTSELQSRENLVCRLLLEKKKHRIKQL